MVLFRTTSLGYFAIAVKLIHLEFLQKTNGQESTYLKICNFKLFFYLLTLSLKILASFKSIWIDSNVRDWHVTDACGQLNIFVIILFKT